MLNMSVRLSRSATLPIELTDVPKQWKKRHNCSRKCTRTICKCCARSGAIEAHLSVPVETKCGAHTAIHIMALIVWELDAKLARLVCCEVGACACFVLQAILISVSTQTYN